MTLTHKEFIEVWVVEYVIPYVLLLMMDYYMKSAYKITSHKLERGNLCLG